MDTGVTIMPDIQSRVVGADDYHLYAKTAFAIPKEVIVKIVISRYPVNFTSKGGLFVLNQHADRHEKVILLLVHFTIPSIFHCRTLNIFELRDSERA